MKYLSYISTTLLGLLFLVSAFAKAWDANSFAVMLTQYGPEWFSIGAPIIIAIESLLGTALLLRVKPRWSALAADAFLVVVSLIFAYGVVVKGIQDCGCFGALSRWFTGKPWTTFVRNAVFIGISVPALLDRTSSKHSIYPRLLAGMVVATITCFVSGLAMRESFTLPQRMFINVEDNRAKTMERLNAIYSFDADSSYIVYLFSFSCAHCQNSFANVQQYQQFGAADKVVGIAIDDEEAQARFNRIYQPIIDIITIPNDTMAQMTGQLPLCIAVREGKIVHVSSGLVTSPGIFIK